MVRQGDPGGTIYFITEGHLEVRLYVQGNQPGHDEDSSVHVSRAGSFTATAAAKQPPKRSTLKGKSRLISDQHLQDSKQQGAGAANSGGNRAQVVKEPFECQCISCYALTAAT